MNTLPLHVWLALQPGPLHVTFFPFDFDIGRWHLTASGVHIPGDIADLLVRYLLTLDREGTHVPKGALVFEAGHVRRLCACSMCGGLPGKVINNEPIRSEL